MTNDTQAASGCPFHKEGANTNIASSNTAWWPNALNLDILSQHDKKKPIQWTQTLTMSKLLIHWTWKQ